MRTLKLVSIFGDRLNLNGDQANLFVLQQRLKWAGFDSKIAIVSNQSELDAAEADFLFLGHGSLAAWKSCTTDWPDLATAFSQASTQIVTMAVASGADLIFAQGESQQIELAQAKLPQVFSEFCTDIFDGKELLGYKNTTAQRNDTVRQNQAILTWLHGPILAKNPTLADEIISQMVGAATSLENENTRKIDEIVAGVWQLEKPQN